MKTDWISCKERTPPAPGIYLVAWNPSGDGPAVMLAYRFRHWCEAEWAYDYWCQWPGCDDMDEGGVTHWAEIDWPPGTKGVEHGKRTRPACRPLGGLRIEED